MSELTTHSRRDLAINMTIIAVIVALFGISMWLGNHYFTGEEAFAGTDAAATEAIEATGYQPWFTHLFKPGSGEIESGLFALQAAIGAGVLGFVLGWYRCKSKYAPKQQ